MSFDAAQLSPSPTVYTRLFQLGSGGMGNVHLALARRRPSFQRLVVLKTIAESGRDSQEARRMLYEEARICARLNHPNVVQVTEIVELDEAIMLVMEYLDGFCLSEALHQAGDAFTLPYRLRAVCEALAGLHYAHELRNYSGAPLGIVHRDVSPPNLFVTYDGRIKVLDFGIAKAENLGDATKTGVVKGRLAYMPAEQFRGEVLDRRADIYAVGCILFEVIANRRLWNGYSRREMISAMSEGQLPKLDSALNVDDRLRAIVERAMQPDRDNRYDSAEQMRLEIEQYLESLPRESQYTSRQLGEMLASTCAQQREDRRKRIAREVQRIERGHSQAPTPIVPALAGAPQLDIPRAPRTPADLEESTRPHGPMGLDAPSVTESGVHRSKQATREATALQREATKTPPGSNGISPRVYMVAAAIMVSSLFLILFHDKLQGAVADLSALPGDSLHESTLVVRTKPGTATVRLDGVTLGSGRVETTLETGSKHLLLVTEDGYRSAEKTIVAKAGSMELEFGLTSLSSPQAIAGAVDPEASATMVDESSPERAESKESTEDDSVAVAGGTPRFAKTTTPRIRPQSMPKQTKKSANTDCNPPYFISGGIKTYKTECL